MVNALLELDDLTDAGVVVEDTVRAGDCATLLQRDPDTGYGLLRIVYNLKRVTGHKERESDSDEGGFAEHDVVRKSCRQRAVVTSWRLRMEVEQEWACC